MGRGSWVRSVALVAVVVVAALLAGPVAHGQERRAVEPPTVVPASGGVKGNAFNALPADYDVDYEEQEYLLSGEATADDLSPVALSSLGAPPADVPQVAPFTTRALARWPRSGFNGTVIVEWLNVTSGYDVEASWAELHRHIVRAGYAYVGVTAQEVGVAGLKAFDPVRYAGLVHPGDQFSFDIFAQAARAARDGELVGSEVPAIVLATGASQSGSALNTYISSVAPRVERVIDGFLVLTSARALPTPDVPVVRVLTEGEAAADFADGPNFRDWEIAGSTHADSHGGEWFERTQSRDWAPGWPLTPRDQALPAECRIGSMPKYYVMHAALDALSRWVADPRDAPPSSPQIAEEADGSLSRDPRTGNTLGGIRTPGVDAPVATYYGDVDQCAPTLGKTVRYTDEQLRAVHGTRARYLTAVRTSAHRAAAAGFLLRADADEIIRSAEASDILR
jgi:hypothetical protein